MNPLVSIVIPTYNRAADLKRAIASVISQTWSNWELWVVDNHSADNTREVVVAFNDPRINFLLVHNHGVIAISRNLGLRHARGEYLAFLDSDDWWKPRKLEYSVGELEAGADIVYHDLYLARSPRTRWSLRRAVTRPLRSPVFEALIERGNALNNSSVVVRRSVVEAVGGACEDRRLVCWEDYDLWLRIARVTEGFRRIPQTLGYYWVGGGSANSAERFISNLGHVRDIYLRRAARAGDAGLPAWYHYCLGRAYHQTGKYSDAFLHIRRAMVMRLPLITRAKAATIAASAYVHFWFQTLRSSLW